MSNKKEIEELIEKIEQLEGGAIKSMLLVMQDEKNIRNKLFGKQDKVSHMALALILLATMEGIDCEKRAAKRFGELYVIAADTIKEYYNYKLKEDFLLNSYKATLGKEVVTISPI